MFVCVELHLVIRSAPLTPTTLGSFLLNSEHQATMPDVCPAAGPRVAWTWFFERKSDNPGVWNHGLCIKRDPSLRFLELSLVNLPPSATIAIGRHGHVGTHAGSHVAVTPYRAPHMYKKSYCASCGFCSSTKQPPSGGSDVMSFAAMSVAVNVYSRSDDLQHRARRTIPLFIL